MTDSKRVIVTRNMYLCPFSSACTVSEKCHFDILCTASVVYSISIQTILTGELWVVVLHGPEAVIERERLWKQEHSVMKTRGRRERCKRRLSLTTAPLQAQRKLVPFTHTHTHTHTHAHFDPKSCLVKQDVRRSMSTGSLCHTTRDQVNTTTSGTPCPPLDALRPPTAHPGLM